MRRCCRALHHPRPKLMGMSPCWHRFFGTSGQNLDDIYKYLESEDRLGMTVNMLKWGHIAPTAPDTLCASSVLS